MKFTILGLFAAIAAVNANTLQYSPPTLVRAPSFDSAVIQSERFNGGFSYRTVENHAYAPVVQTVSLSWNLLDRNLNSNFCKRCHFFVNLRTTLKSPKSTTQDKSFPSTPEFIHNWVVILSLEDQLEDHLELHLVSTHKIQLKLKIQQTISQTKQSNKETMKTLCQLIQHEMWMENSKPSNTH